MSIRFLGILALLACAAGLSGCVAVDGGHSRYHHAPSHHYGHSTHRHHH